MIGINAGSGQRPFDKSFGWVNIDTNPRWNPDIVADWNDLSMFDNASVDIVVSHHSIEHVGCGEAEGFIKESHRVLRKKGSLLVFIPDIKALAQRWIVGQLNDFQFFVNVYGAYMGDEADRHRWGYSREGIVRYLKGLAPWSDVHAYDFRRSIPGADIANDWWIIGIEATK